MRRLFIAAARAANLAFFLVTATYCLLSYSPFAYQNFIRPHMIAALASFVVWHHLWFWLMLAITALTLTHALAGQVLRPAGAWIAWTYLIVSLGVAILLSARPVLPQVDNSSRGLLLAVVALAWPLWLAMYDHAATAASFEAVPSSDGRLFRASMFTALFVWASQVVAVPWRLDQSGDIPLTHADIAFGAVTSLVAHLATFGAIGLAVVALLRLARSAGVRGVAEYWLIVSMSAIAATIMAGRLVFGSISFTGPVAWAMAALLGTVLALVWSSIARRLSGENAGRAGPRSALDVWLTPLGASRSWPGALVLLLALVAVGHYALARAVTFDWDFLLQKLIVLAIWLLAFALIHSALDESAPVGKTFAGMPLIAIVLCVGQGAIEPRVAGVVRAAGGLNAPPFVAEFVLDGYVGLDTSYRLIRDAVWTEPPGSSAFYRYLDANTLLERFDIPPVEGDLRRAEGVPDPRPNIFLFTIDSLRPDYLLPYNPAATFTPEIGKFAAESVVFRHAFTRYGGTGLSMPAIWAGAMMIHKQYVTPFQPMNLLEHLLDANGYQMWLGMDHITHDILAPRGPSIELDRGRDEMDYDFCGTLGEIESNLLSNGQPHAPVFAHTRPLNLHVSKLRNRTVPYDPAYAGFQGPAAAAVRHIDGCFGGFVSFLKQHGLYDSSVIVLMSDHGDSLGEENRWGHAMTLFPEVVGIPLIVHVPTELKTRLAGNRDALAFSTDVTPTLCALLGYVPTNVGAFFGVPLFDSNASNAAELAARAKEPQLLASSYGPVYALLSDNGRTLYIADAVNRRDYKYDLSALRPVRLGITADERAASRQIIEGKLHELAALYHFSPDL